MENVQQSEKSFGGYNSSVSTFHYKILEYKWRIQNVSCMPYYSEYKSPPFTVDCQNEWYITFYSQPWERYDLKILFLSKNKYGTMAIPSLQILSGKRKLISEEKMITINHEWSWGFVNEKPTDLIDDDDSLTVLCRIKISLQKMTTTQIMNLPPSSLLEDLGSMMSSCNLFDVALVYSDGKQLKAHRGMLAARSPVFASMFSHSMKEKQSGRVVVSDVDYEVMKALLDFANTDRIPSVVSELTYKLLAVADKYNLARLKAACEQHIMVNINVGNACSILVATEQHHLRGLRQHILQFMKDNIQSIISTDGWSEAALKCPQALSELSSFE